MTIKLLTKKEKETMMESFIKDSLANGDIDEEVTDREYIAGYYDKKTGNYVYGTYKDKEKRKRTKDEIYQEAENLLMDLEQDNGYYVTLDEFPDCCGAAVLCGFAYRGSSKAEFTDKEKLAVTLAINNRLNPSYNGTRYPFIFAILNANQQKRLQSIFERFGGEMIAPPKVGFHKIKIYPWLFTYGKKVKKEKRVFG